MQAKKLTLIRHGSLESSLDDCYVGRLDVPLSSAGKRQSLQLADRLSATGIDALWSSPALRAVETARPLVERLDLPCCIKNELGEVHFGRWEGLTFEQIRAMDPQLVDLWADPKADFCFPEGESRYEFRMRVSKVAQRIISSECQHLALVSHGGVIKTLLCLLLQWPDEDFFKVSIQRGGFATLDIHAEGAVLTGLYNE